MRTDGIQGIFNVQVNVLGAMLTTHLRLMFTVGCFILTGLVLGTLQFYSQINFFFCFIKLCYSQTGKDLRKVRKVFGLLMRKSYLFNMFLKT